MPAALNSAGGKLQGAGCRVWAANLYLHKDWQLSQLPKLLAQLCKSLHYKCIVITSALRHNPSLNQARSGVAVS